MCSLAAWPRGARGIALIPSFYGRRRRNRRNGKLAGNLADLIPSWPVNKRLENASISRDEATSETHPSRAARGPRAGDEERSRAREEDLLLVERARSGDADAFRDLFERYHRRAYSLALGVVKHPDDALDVVQDAFIKAHRHLASFEGNSSFYTWLYRIVMNLAIDHIRRQKRARHVDYADALANSEGEAAAGDAALLPRILGQNPSKSLMRKEIREQISEALAALSENHRAVLVLREVEGLSYEEMAEVMGCSKGTIMSRLFHARKNMQRHLLEFMGGEKDLDA